MKAVIDRIEEDLAVLELEGKHEVLWPLKLLPKGAKPGNILDINISLNLKAEQEQKEEVKKLQNKLLRENEPK